MVRSRHARSFAPAEPAPPIPRVATLHDGNDVMPAVLAAAEAGPATLCFVADAEGRGLACLIVDDHDDADTALALAEAASNLPEADRLVLVTVTDDLNGHALLSDATTATWTISMVDETLAAAGVELLDWFVAEPGMAVSVLA